MRSAIAPVKVISARHVPGQDPNSLKSVLSLYQQFVSPTVTKADLIHNGKYVPKDKYNNSTTNGAMHLVQGANTLGAEIDISVRSTIIRKINGTVLTGERELID